MSNRGVECVIQCKYCAKSLSVTPNAQKIRCHQCSVINSIRENQKSTIITTPPNGTNIKAREAHNNNIYIDAKGLHNPFRKRSNSNSPKAVYPTTTKGMDLRISEWKVTPGKRALLCGVSYNKQKFKLKGTINDVESMKNLLFDNFHFPSSSIQILAGNIYTHTHINIF